MSYNCPLCKDRGSFSYRQQHCRFEKDHIIYEICECQNLPSDEEYWTALAHCDNLILDGKQENLSNYIQKLHPSLHAEFNRKYGVK